MWRAAAGALASHWRRHPGQAATLLLGLALATALWTGVQAINSEARASYDRAAQVVSQENRPVLRARDGGPVPLADYVALRRAGWAVAPVLEGRATIGGRGVSLIGLDPLSAPVLPAATEPADGADPLPEEDGATALAAFIGPPGRLFAAPGTAGWLSDAVPQQVLISEDVAPGTAIGDIGTVADLLAGVDDTRDSDAGGRGDPSRLVLIEDPPPGATPLSALAPGLVRGEPEAGAGIGGLTGSFHLNLTAFGLLSFTVGLFIVHGAVGLAFEQRRGMFRTLRALGLTRRALALLLAAELALAATLAGAAGVALGYVIAAALLPDVAATLRGLYGAPASGALALRPGWIAAGFAMAWLGTALASTQALWRLARLPVLSGAQPRAWALASGTAQARQALAGLGALTLAGIAAAAGDGLIAGFAALGGLLLGAALVLPWLLAQGLAAAQSRAQGPLAEWFWADTRQQLPGLSLALMALMLALAANIGVSTMVGSFRATFTGWLDQRLAAEIYLDAGTEARAQQIAAWLDPRVNAILPQVWTEARLDGRPAQLRGLADHATYRETWPLLGSRAGVWDALARGEGILVNEQFALRSGTGPGDTVTLDGRAARVLAVYSDYGNPLAEAAVSLDAFTAAHPDLPVTRFALRLPPAEVPALMEALRDLFGLGSDALRDQAALKALSLAIFERTFAVTGALNVLTLGVAALAMLTSLLTLAAQRLPQVAPIWAAGLPRARLGHMELARAALLALGTAAAAIPVGLALAWVLLAVVNVAAFGWRLPMQVFPADWLRLTALALAAALAASALPARRLSRRPPADLLKVFASDR
ncbi:ABC transporter permease [Meridianimarinicoccus roseus]|uniref:ABC transporter permease n=1 Tax=Meridianimarinicoccus roseus TaxID=2072018 RepID=A0A2V2L5W8_9RHOB|nr:FtsX-like permease family protein [Meridianimarinicoccus roseus]PWR00802.1 ABC transporter permease [Meridianimarinicoccus roseus]